MNLSLFHRNSSGVVRPSAGQRSRFEPVIPHRGEIVRSISMLFILISTAAAIMWLGNLYGLIGMFVGTMAMVGIAIIGDHRADSR